MDNTLLDLHNSSEHGNIHAWPVIANCLPCFHCAFCYLLEKQVVPLPISEPSSLNWFYPVVVPL